MTDNSVLHLKRFAQRKWHRGDDHQQTTRQSDLTLELNTRIRDYVNGRSGNTNAPAYVSHKEIPTSEEISVGPNDKPEDEVDVPVNQVVGPWESKRKYLSDHYALLREDAVAPLRNVVSEMKADPWVLEKDSIEHSYIYEKVSFEFSTVGMFIH